MSHIFRTSTEHKTTSLAEEGSSAYCQSSGDLSMLISIGYMCSMLCAPLDWQYAELPSSASDAVLCYVLV